MSGLSVLKVYGSLPDLFKMFNSTIGTFHRTDIDALQRSSLGGLRWLRRYNCIEPVSNLEGIAGRISQISTKTQSDSRRCSLWDREGVPQLFKRPGRKRSPGGT